MSRSILALVSITNLTVLAACATPGDVDSDAWAWRADIELVFASADGLALDAETMLDLVTADDPAVPAWEYLDAAPMGELTEAAPLVFSGDLGHQGYSVAEVVVPAGGQLRVDPSYCGSGNTGCVVYVAVDWDGDTMLEVSEVEAYADGRLGEVAEATVGGGVWSIFVSGSIAAVDGFVVEILWSVPGGSDGTAS